MSLMALSNAPPPGLNPAQVNLRSTPDNIARVNSPGSVRKPAIPSPLVAGGQGAGLSVEGAARTADRYLRLANLTASSDAGRWSVISQELGDAQGLFDLPRPDDIFTAFAAAADDPSPSRRSRAIAQVQDFLAQSARIDTQSSQFGEALDGRISADIDRANDLLGQISQLNAEISRSKLAIGEASDPESNQSQLVDELVTLMSARVAPKANGGVTVRSAEGLLLAGDGGAATLSYNRADPTKGYVAVEPEGEIGFAQPIQITGGEIAGLIELRDTTLPALADQLGEFVWRTAELVNAAYNKTTPSPAPNLLAGRDMGLDLQSAVSGFTGSATIAVVGAAGADNGVVQHEVEIDFDAMTMKPGGDFEAANFLPVLNRALGGAATANFTDGALSIQGAAGTGVGIDEGGSMKGGRGFSHVFGMNDLIRSAGARFKVDPAVVENPMKLGLGLLDLSVAAGGQAITADDSRGARLLGEVSTTLGSYAAELGGSAQRQVQIADARKNTALAIAKEAAVRREAIEGVSLDEELIVMTTYQQASSAAARMAQAARGLSNMLAQIA
ncbi:MAG: hypothetical protein Q7T84_00085 [Phenylobacterium sp.]|uniref:FlgK family flagellar hook-associated protein n=1 Tax=Phenylobacterium sp. TaxID=1871053 RepID=UPI00271A107D|nr:hypothetical protein [Phenylobacterium sp.]MDO9429675.1 hypothetical protein [Phenylobacterium sp.]